MERLPEIMEILDKMNFFQGQRAGRELWNDKPFEVQEEDLENFKRDINTIRSYIWEIVKKLKAYEDAEEQGLLLKKEKAVDEGYLYDWYIHSTMGDEPIWTEAHLEELFNDFILIPKEEAEQALAKMKEGV